MYQQKWAMNFRARLSSITIETVNQ